jgi:S-adenosylmethionine uptake transporter
VAQPGANGISPYALAAFGCAFFSVGRDLAGKRVPQGIPALVVSYSIILCVLAGSGVMTLLFERWVMPDLRHALLLAGSGLFLSIGHFCLFMSYRTGATGVVAPFFYMLAVWAVISQLIVFGSLPNPLAIAGIALILVSGVTIALFDERKRRLTITA